MREEGESELQAWVDEEVEEVDGAQLLHGLQIWNNGQHGLVQVVLIPTQRTL